MDSSNPYQPPAAVLGEASLGGEAELAGAVAPFVASYRPLRILGLLCALAGLVSGLGMLSGGAVPEGRSALMFGAITGAYLMASIFLFRLASSMRTLAKEPTMAKVTAVLDRMTQTWVVGLGALVLLTLGSWTQRLASTIAVSPLLSQIGPQDGVIVSARKLRRVLVMVVGTTVVVMIVGVAGVFVKPPPEMQGMSTSMVRSITLASALVQLAMQWLVWRQVPALDELIARPSAASLRRVAAAHALIWRVVVAGIGLVFLLGLVAAVALPILFRR